MRSKSDIEAKTLRILRSLNFEVTGYYPYEHATNLVGNLKLPEPFTTPIKTAVEIAKSPISRESVESFANFGRNILAPKLAIFYEDDFDNLDEDVRSTILAIKIDYVGGEVLRELLSRSTVTLEEARQYRNSLDIIAAKRLVGALPELSRETVPDDIRNILGKKTAWEIMEEAVFAAFHDCFGYETQELGHYKRFKSEPEGVVVTSNLDPFALLYDCKSTKKDAYGMSKEDERAVIDYVNYKKGEIKARYSCELRYFIIVGPDFKGRLDLRRDNIHSETNVLLVFVKAEALRAISLWAYKIPPRYRSLIDLRKILKVGKKVIEEQDAEAYMRQFDSTYQKAYGSD